LKKSFRDVHIIEFGSGDPTKISVLFEYIPDYYRETISYVPFDVSDVAIQESCNILLQKFPRLTIHGIVADFMTQLDVIPKRTNKILCFLGSTIGNFTNSQATEFLKELDYIMNQGDRLILGFDMVKNKNILEKAYNDNQKVTEQFNKNILNVVNRIIDTDFDPDQFEHVAFYNTDFSRIEMYLKAKKQMTISSPKLASSIHIDKGEMIHTEHSHKFTLEQIKNFAKSTNLEIEKIFSDGKNWFSLVILTKPKER
jgi:L-histidine Nalpha-methyltransferase